MTTLFAVLGAVTIYVSPVGNDANDGSEKSPLATVEAARNAVRKIKAANGGAVPAGGVEVVFEDGLYRLDKTLELTTEDSGAAGAPVVWRARNRGKAFGAANEIYRLESKIRIVKDRPVTIRFKFRGIE